MLSQGSDTASLADAADGVKKFLDFMALLFEFQKPCVDIIDFLCEKYAKTVKIRLHYSKCGLSPRMQHYPDARQRIIAPGGGQD